MDKLLSEERSSSTLDGDSDGLEIIPQIALSSSPHSTAPEKTPDGKRKRSRSSSLSLTPPPEVSIEERKRNRELIALVISVIILYLLFPERILKNN